jgi:2-phosphoglycolate phosphatase
MGSYRDSLENDLSSPHAPHPSSLILVCFDFDGTLADNFEAIARSVNHVRARWGLEPWPTSQVKRHVGRGLEYLVGHTVPVGEPAENIATYREFFPKVMREGMKLMPGAAEALAHLHRVGKKIALCSNKQSEYSRELLKSLDIASYFSAVLGPEDVARPKPAPDMLLAAMERHEMSAAQTLYVGDMVVDILTARAAGVCVWSVPNGSEDVANLIAARPDRLLSSLADLMAIS